VKNYIRETEKSRYFIDSKSRNTEFLTRLMEAGMAHNSNRILKRLSEYRMSQEECGRLREGVPYVKVCRYNPKHLCPKLTSYGDNGPEKSETLTGVIH
jgi:hypothetical protein